MGIPHYNVSQATFSVVRDEVDRVVRYAVVVLSYRYLLWKYIPWRRETLIITPGTDLSDPVSIIYSPSSLAKLLLSAFSQNNKSRNHL